MQIPSINGFQQVAAAVPLVYGPNDQPALCDCDVEGRACGYFRLDGE